MIPLLVNCNRLPFGRTLGVSHFLLKLCKALSEHCDLLFAVPNRSDFENSAAAEIINGIASQIMFIGEANNRLEILSNNRIELLPHHFQSPEFCDKSAMICHDLHVFDIGWKYQNVEDMRDLFRRNFKSASVVITEFPRTFYSVENVAGVHKRDLYLTDSPLLLNTDFHSCGQVRDVRNINFPLLLYPAQLQKHKNHESLILALKRLKKKFSSIKILCPGTTFDEQFTRDLKKQADEHDVSENITFLGRVSDSELCQLYWKCDGVIVPSMAEGGAYVALEALAAGKPVAVNDIDSARQHVKAISGEVIWFNSESLEGTVSAVEQLLEKDIQTWFEINSVARSRIAGMTWSNVAKQWLTILDWMQGKTERPIMHVNRDGAGIEIKQP